MIKTQLKRVSLPTCDLIAKVKKDMVKRLNRKVTDTEVIDIFKEAWINGRLK